ncbi:MAG TPA: TIGR03085 family metal-binding protein [Acidimicrobiales bacterium]|nr:TIGR03085 family metal-binding protein [Acidimicrobiales bacterium]
MPDEPLDARERAELCDLFVAKGADAPTLCEGWATLDLAAHLVVRETDPRAGLAILGGDRFASLERKLMDRARAQGYERLVERLRGGPPAVPWRLPGLRPLLNLNEWFVHHEDVRRAGGDVPRTDRPDLDAALWAGLGRASRFMLRRVKGAGVALEAPGFGEVPARADGPAARIVGGPQELVLYLTGRRSAARVEVTGPEGAVAAVEAANLGL